MHWNYIGKIIWRNKKRTGFLMLGIIIAVSLIVGVDGATNRFFGQMMEDRLGDIVVDYRMTARTLTTRSIDSELNELVGSSDILTDYFRTFYFKHDLTFIQKGGGNVNWTTLLSSNSDSWSNYTKFAGIDRNIMTDPEIAPRLRTFWNFPNDIIDLSSNGLYINALIASQHNLSVGENISIGFLYRQYNYDGPSERVDNVTASISNIPIIGIYSLLNPTAVSDFFESSYGYYGYGGEMLFVGNITYIQSLYSVLDQAKNNAEIEDYGDLNAEVAGYSIYVDYNQLPFTDPTAAIQILDRLEKKMLEIGGNGNLYSVTGTLKNAISMISMEIQSLQTIMFIVSGPVIILAWFLVRTNYLTTYQQRRRELGLLKSKGGRSRQIKADFAMEAVIIGSIGGIFGYFLGSLSVNWVTQLIYPAAVQNMPFLKFDWLLLLYSVLGGAALSLIAVWKPLGTFTAQNPVDSLQKYADESETELSKKKSDWILLILGAIPLILTIATDILQQLNLDAVYLFFMISMMLTPLLPLSPFLLIYALVKILCARSIAVFSRLVGWISRIFTKQISVFTTKSILRNQARSARLVFIVAMSLSFMLLASSVQASTAYYLESYQTITTGDGVPVTFWRSNLNSTQIQMYDSALRMNSTDLEFSQFTKSWDPERSAIVNDDGSTKNFEHMKMMDYFYGPVSVRAIDADNYSKYIHWQDRWFIGGKAQTLLARLNNEANTALAPAFLQNYYSLGDLIPIKYSNMTNNNTNISVQIIGFYENFPLITSNYDRTLIVAESTLPNALIQKCTYIFYGEDDIEPQSAEITEFLKDLDPIITTSQYGWDDNYYQPTQSGDDFFTQIMLSVTRFLDLESYYMLIIVTLGVGIIMYLSIKEKSREMGILRARGIEKRVIFKIQIAEGTTLILLGLLLSFIGLVGAYSIIVQFSTIFMALTSLKWILVVPWIKIILQLILAMTLFLGVISLAVAIETKQSDIGKIGELLRLT
jgi:ABC-type antimicrobial peptide transport system permease subunit